MTLELCQAFQCHQIARWNLYSKEISGFFCENHRHDYIDPILEIDFDKVSGEWVKIRIPSGIRILDPSEIKRYRKGDLVYVYRDRDILKAEIVRTTRSDFQIVLCGSQPIYGSAWVDGTSGRVYDRSCFWDLIWLAPTPKVRSLARSLEFQA